MEFMPIFLELDANPDEPSNRGTIGNYLNLKHDILNKTYNIEIEKLNLNVEIHSKNTFSETEKNGIKNYIHDAVNEFIKYIYDFSVNVPFSKAEIYLIDNVDEYRQYCDQYGLLGKDTRGVTYIGDRVTPSRVYLYKEGNSIVGLKHELSYVLQDHVTEHKLANVINNDLLLSVISDAIADFCEYHDSVLDQMCAERKVFDKIYGSSEFDKYSNKSVYDVLEEIKDNNFKDVDLTIRDFGFTFLNFSRNMVGENFCTLILNIIKQEDSSTLGKTLSYLTYPVNNSAFKQFLQEQLSHLELMYKDQHDISQDVRLQYVANDDFNGDIEADKKLQIVNHKHFDDREVVHDVGYNMLNNVVNKLEGENMFDIEDQFAIGLSGPRIPYMNRNISNGYDTPPDVPMSDGVRSSSSEECSDPNKFGIKLTEKNFRDDVCNNVHSIRNDDYKLDLKIYALKELPYRRLYEIEKGLNDTITKFRDSFGLEPNDEYTTIELYVFDNIDQYEHYGARYNLGIVGSGGKAFYGNANTPYKVYVHAFGNILNLEHELAHVLESYACGHRVYEVKGNSRIFSEGIAEYIQDDNSFILEGMRNKERVYDVLHDKHGNMDKAVHDAVALQYETSTKDGTTVPGMNPGKQYLEYGVGQAFVTFLQEEHPGIITEYFKACKTGDFIRAAEIISIDKYSDFMPWVESKDISLYLENMNMLKLDLGDKMLSDVNTEVFERPGKHTEYYYQNICNMKGEIIGEISPVVQYSSKHLIRSWNTASNDHMHVAPEYNFVKLVSSPSGKNAYVYCNKYGEEYFNSEDYVNSVFNILRKYNPEIAAISDSLNSRMYSDIDIAFSQLNNSDLLLNKYLSSVNEDERSLFRNPKNYSIAKIRAMDYALANFKKEQVYKALNNLSDADLKISNIIKGSTDINLDSEIINIIKGLTYINLDSVIGVNGCDVKSITSDPNVMLRAVILGKGDNSAISLYDMDNHKVGEFLTEAGYCIKNIDTNSVIFTFRDIMKMISSSYPDKAYMVVSEEDGLVTTTLVNDIQRTVSGDVIWGNKFNHPSVSHFHPGYENFLLHNASVRNGHYIVDEESSTRGTVITRGEILDDKGTASIDDDIYRAVITQDNEKILHQFKSMSFYITEPHFDGSRNYGSDFTITDEGKGLRFQLPKTITHLKLVNFEGSKKLVPCTASGDENPDGMPSYFPDEYRYIDPIFAHKFEKPCYSNKSISIGLVDFDKYEEGSLFKLQHYDKDYRVYRDEHGNIVRPQGIYYKTKVDLVYDDEVIGMLSDTINQFQGDIFISLSRNYSHNDFLASENFQKVDIKELADGIYSGTYNVTSDDILEFGTDTGYSDQAVFYFKGNDSTNISTISPYQGDLV